MSPDPAPAHHPVPPTDGPVQMVPVPAGSERMDRDDGDMMEVDTDMDEMEEVEEDDLDGAESFYRFRYRPRPWFHRLVFGLHE